MNIYELALSGDSTAIETAATMSKNARCEVEVSPKDVIAVLHKYIANQINDEYLVRWADLLVSNEAYICPNWQDDVFVDMHEPMWYVLQRIASPAVDGNLSVDKINFYLKEVENVEQKLAKKRNLGSE